MINLSRVDSTELGKGVEGFANLATPSRHSVGRYPYQAVIIYKVTPLYYTRRRTIDSWFETVWVLLCLFIITTAKCGLLNFIIMSLKVSLDLQTWKSSSRFCISSFISPTKCIWYGSCCCWTIYITFKFANYPFQKIIEGQLFPSEHASIYHGSPFFASCNICETTHLWRPW